MKSTEVWKSIHAERSDLIDTWSGLTSEQWATPSLCAGWTVQDVAGHLLASAEQTPPNFFKGLAQSGFKFNVFVDRDAKRNAAAGPTELVRRMQLRTSTTNGPPAPSVSMLGEVVVHGADIRRPLGLTHRPSDAMLAAVADSWKNSNLLIGGKRRVAGLRLTANDMSWTNGDGPEVRGPMYSLVLALSGRKDALRDLTGEGVSILATRP